MHWERSGEAEMSGSGSEAATNRTDAASMLQIRVLGPLEIAWGGKVVDLGGVKARALIARLLIDRGLIVSVDRLVDSMWGDRDGDGAEIALRSTISRLRKRLRQAGAPEDVIVTRAPGYALEVASETTDVFVFEQMVADGRRLLGRRRPSESLRALKAAQELWRGSAYSEVRDEPFARAEARRLEELLLAAIETRIDAEITLGRHESLTGELETLTSEHPMRERLWSQRMLALYRSGRQAEALSVFQELRSTLVTELGIEPSQDVSWMEHAILAQEPALSFPVPAEPPPEVPAVPAAAGGNAGADSGYRVRIPTSPNEGLFVGRDRESALLRDWWGSVGRGDGGLLLVDGDPGIGKTRLVGELARAVEGEGALVLWGRCDEDPVAPFQPFAEALGRYFHAESADRISGMPEWQLAELSRLVLRLREYAPPFEPDAGDPENNRFRFFEAVTATLSELSSNGTILLVIDDLHWADQPTLLLMRHVLRNIDRAKLGVVGMYIDTEVSSEHRLRTALADLRSGLPVETVHLQGLSEDGVEELVRGWKSAPEDLAPRLHKLTDGNPLFLEEMLRQVVERGSGRANDGVETPVPPDLDPPEAIRELVARRVSRLPEDVIYLLQAAAVSGQECEASIVAEAAELSPEQQLDAFDRAEESRLLRRVGGLVRDRYAFSHALVRDAIYGELLRGRRVRYHHKIAVATERGHGGALDRYVNELAHHFYMGAALADSDKAIRYCTAAGERALRLLAFEEAVGHLTRALEVTEKFGGDDPSTLCDTLIALAEAQNRAGDAAQANTSFERAASLARSIGDPERLASTALRAGPLTYLGIVGAHQEQIALLEEALAALPGDDAHLRARVTAQLGLIIVASAGVPGPGVLDRALALNSDAVAMARRLGDRVALGYALRARMHVLWGIDPAPERLALGTELGQIADDVGDQFLALHGHMWRVRELLAQGDVDAVNDELARFEARDPGPVHPLEASYSLSVGAMMALVAGDFEQAEWMARRGMEVAEGHNELVVSFYGVLMAWTWWQRGELVALEQMFRDVIEDSLAGYPIVRAALALIHAESGQLDQAMADLDALAAFGWEVVARDQTEGVSLALVAAACGAVGARARDHASLIYEQMRPYAGTAVVIRAPAAGCVGPADQYLGLLATATGDLALAEVHFEAALRLAHRMHSEPFEAAAEVELARVLRQRGREGEEERVAILLRHAEESALRLGLPRLAGMAADPG
ncbi:MAG TPA: BTAD domain-containing putative transcriptional regulator [Acidimicrobiales bacterium]|nr:BTAD domain-containing putative transcriptional regulator [Acidimicrobiales bacterium]